MKPIEKAVDVSANVNVDNEFMSAAIMEAVKAAVVSSMGDPRELISSMVGTVLSKYVDSDGKECSRDSWRARPYLDWLTERVVLQAASDCVREVVQENQGEFKQAILHQLCTRKFQDQTASAFCQAILSSASSAWRMPITVSFKSNED